jgi:hypothetical protein
MRSYFDYATYLIRTQRGPTLILLVDACLLIAAWVAFLHPAQSSAGRGAVTITMLLVTGRLVWSCYKIQRTVRTYLHTSDAVLIQPPALNQPFGPVRLDEIQPSRAEAAAGFEARDAGGERVFHSQAVDEFLWEDGPLAVVLGNTKKPERVKQLLDRNRAALLRLLTRRFLDARGKQLFFNEEKLCLASQIDPATKQVTCYRGCYFDALLTNEACTKALTDEHGNLLADLTSMFPVHCNSSQSTVYLDDIAQSAMSDHIGISTLGFTRDAHIVIWEQSSRALQSPHLLAPTGSGSCDWKDLDLGDFRNTLRRAMERELCEESCLRDFRRPSVIGSTLILGFYRWLRRGGHPDFVGITRLNVDRHDLEPDLLETRRPSAKRQHMFPLPTIDHIPSLLEEIRGYGQLSVPLAMNLHSLEHFHAKRGERLAAFLYGSPP